MSPSTFDTALVHCRALDAQGILLLSTELFDEREHGPDWWYLTPEHGQHVTVLSRSGLAGLLERAALRWHGSIRLQGRRFLHVITLQGRAWLEGTTARLAAKARRWERWARVRAYLELVMMAARNPGEFFRRVRNRLMASRSSRAVRKEGRR